MLARRQLGPRRLRARQRRLRPRHARRRHHRRQRRLVHRHRTYFQTFYGIAPQANLVNVRVLDGQGQGDVSTRHRRHPVGASTTRPKLQHPRPEPVPGPPGRRELHDRPALPGRRGRLEGRDRRRLRRRQRRAGSTAPPTPGLDNEGYGTAYGSIKSPGNDPYVITVGAMKSMDGSRADDQIATYSVRGPSRAATWCSSPTSSPPATRSSRTLAKDSYLETPVQRRQPDPTSRPTAEHQHADDTPTATSGCRAPPWPRRWSPAPRPCCSSRTRR